jgi:hypothetical protein
VKRRYLHIHGEQKSAHSEKIVFISIFETSFSVVNIATAMRKLLQLIFDDMTLG